ncbi:MAG: antibiotic biosynthesis monooxygenase, partial [Gammaproteobacteria bacterium]|nr:antibiotic biosynthesis monooxygenase [Gammaproteobacteria bacterium]
IEATRLNHEASTDELGNQRFDVLQMDSDPTRFVLYEAYDSVEDATAHKMTSHYLQWRKTVADWMASPREGIVYKCLYPQIGDQW